MRLPHTAHTSLPWRIHELTRDFRLEDVWALPTPGGPDDFPRLVRQIAASDPSRSFPVAARALWELRDKVGELLGWDSPDAGIGPGAPTLRGRLPADLRNGPSGPEFDALPATSLYVLDDEFAAEGANRTTHGVMHLGWVPDGSGGYRGQLAVLVKPNGLFGEAYMAAIKPFRYLIVYPALMRMIGREWRASNDPSPGGTNTERASVSSAVGPRDVPEVVRSLSTMRDPDYVDLFTLRTAGTHDRSAERWARALFEDVAGLSGQLIWRVLLGLRLGWRRTPDCVAGWKIADRGDGWIRLEADSRIMTGHLVVQAGDDRVSLATFIRYRRPLAARIWKPLSRKHRQLAPGLLREALERLQEPEVA